MLAELKADEFRYRERRKQLLWDMKVSHKYAEYEAKLAALDSEFALKWAVDDHDASYTPGRISRPTTASSQPPPHMQPPSPSQPRPATASPRARTASPANLAASNSARASNPDVRRSRPRARLPQRAQSMRSPTQPAAQAPHQSPNGGSSANLDVHNKSMAQLSASTPVAPESSETSDPPPASSLPHSPSMPVLRVY